MDELTGVNGPGLPASYTYDPLGNRNSQTVNGVTTQFLIDPTGLGDVVSTYTGSSLTAHYTYGLGLVSQVSASGSAAYYDFNLTGDTIGITGATGSYVNKYSYLPFGQTTAITAALANPFTFVGEFGGMQDGTTLVRMGAREYSATTGQFLSNDPLGLDGGDPNIRRYVANNPVNAVDPTGTQQQPDQQFQTTAPPQGTWSDADRNGFKIRSTPGGGTEYYSPATGTQPLHPGLYPLPTSKGWERAIVPEPPVSTYGNTHAVGAGSNLSGSAARKRPKPSYSPPSRPLVRPQRPLLGLKPSQAPRANHPRHHPKTKRPGELR